MKRFNLLTLIFSVTFLCFSAAHAFGKDDWIHVRSQNFNLIGNASEKDVRRVATKLEQFREAFRLMFSGSKLTSPIPTNVIVFKSDAAYKPFKPKRADGKTDNFIAGYFQPGADVNYITLSVSGSDEDVFGTIFHEYVHFIVNTNIGKSGVPAWFNEGLAEYYQTFKMEDDIKAQLGIPQSGHLALLQQSKLLPLNAFFNTDNAGLQGHGNGARSVFYAQAWAIVHYLIANQKTAGLDKYLQRSMSGSVDEAAFREAFQLGYAEMEKELRKYVEKASFAGLAVTFNKKLNFDTSFVVTPLSEPESNAYLGDLLFHTNREDDAEPLLTAALAADPGHSMASTTMGMVKVRQGKYSEAKTHLDRAIAKDPKNHLAYYQLAYLLSRESRDDLGFVSTFPAEKANRMRELLTRSIELNPSFTESYELMAFVNIVTNEKLDEGVAAMRKALQYQPGNQRYALRIAEIYLRQDKLNESRSLAERISKTADDPQIKSQADNLLDQLRTRQDIAAHNEAQKKRYEQALASGAKDVGLRPFLVKRGADGREPSAEELKKQSLEFEVRAINRELRKPVDGDVRILGKLERIDCKAGKITYTVTEDGAAPFTLTSKDFQGLHLASYVVDGGNAEVGCDARTNVLRAVLTYRPQKAAAAAAPRGDLVAVEFVPAHFRLMDPADAGSAPAVEESAEQPPIVVESAAEAIDAGPREDPDAARRKMVLDHIRREIRQPATGELRIMGTIERSECSAKGAFFFVRYGESLLKLSVTGTAGPQMRAFTPDVEHLKIGCGMKAVDVPAVVIYRDAPDKKAKTDGELIALEFVPKSFTLE